MIKQGDTIGIIALGGSCEKQLIKLAVQNIEDMGFKVKLSKNIYDQDRYLAGSDGGKLNELHEFFQDPEIKLILNARGGYGSIRIINKINQNHNCQSHKHTIQISRASHIYPACYFSIKMSQPDANDLMQNYPQHAEYRNKY